MEELVSYDSSPKRLKSTFQSTSNFSGEFLFILVSRILLKMRASSFKIIDAMGGVTADVKKEDVIEIPTGHESDSVADWLLSLGLQQYSGMLLSNGYDDINFLVKHSFE